MSTTRLFRIMVCVAVTFLMPARALAGEPTKQIRQTTDNIIAILKDPALDTPDKAQERRRLIRKAAEERFDWREMARRSLARHWARRTPEEKKEFVNLFTDLLEHTYMKKIDSYSGEEVYYEGERIDDGYAVVEVTVVTSQDTEIPVVYRLKKENGDWLVYDVAIERVSLVNNYRVQFNSIILRSSYENLVERLRAKISQG
ncbi:MAG: phospholipid-binding protein MlaC [Syntrophobacteria bacterium]